MPFYPLRPLFLTCYLAVIPLAGAAPTRIMPMGDSITQNEPGFRGPLYEMLIEAGCEIEFVGPKKGVGGGHAGFGGFTIGPGKSKADEWTNGKGNLFDNLDSWLKIKPDIVLVLIGVNDFFTTAEVDPGYSADKQGPERLGRLLDKINALSPKSRVLVSSVLPVGWNPKFAHAFNGALPGVIAKRPFATFVDLNQQVGFVAGDWQKDNLHLSSSGDEKVAKCWFAALAPMLPKSAELAEKARAAKSTPKPGVESPRGVQTGLWNFRSQKPSYGYAAWENLGTVGKQVEGAWSVDASPTGGFGLVFPQPVDLSKGARLVVKMRKDAAASSVIHLKLLCENGSRSFTILNADVPATLGEVTIDLTKQEDGAGDISAVKQIQIQGNFDKTQRFAYSFAEIHLETAP